MPDPPKVVNLSRIFRQPFATLHPQPSRKRSLDRFYESIKIIENQAKSIAFHAKSLQNHWVFQFLGHKNMFSISIDWRKLVIKCKIKVLWIIWNVWWVVEENSTFGKEFFQVEKEKPWILYNKGSINCELHRMKVYIQAADPKMAIRIIQLDFQRSIILLTSISVKFYISDLL